MKKALTFLFAGLLSASCSVLIACHTAGGSTSTSVVPSTSEISVIPSASETSISTSTSVSTSETPSTDTYTVKFFNCRGEQIGETQNVEKGKAAVEPSESARQVEGFIFYGWDHSYQNINKDTDVYGFYYSLNKIANYLEVTFDSANGISSKVCYVKTGALLPEPVDPSKSGCSFDGWYLGMDKWNFAEDTITSNVTLVAHWSLV